MTAKMTLESRFSCNGAIGGKGTLSHLEKYEE
jgi:hypothetical protein